MKLTVCFNCRRGENSLHYAVRSGHPEFVKLLLEHGVNPRQTSTEGKNPLEEAIQFNITKVLSVLEGKSNSNTLYPRISFVISNSFYYTLLSMLKIISKTILLNYH